MSTETNLPPTINFTPSSPIKVGDQTYTTLTLRKMKARDRVAADLVKGEQRKVFAVYASMAGVPIGVIEELDSDDFDRLEEEAKSLVGKLMRDREEMQAEMIKTIMTQAALELAKELQQP